MFQQEDVSAQTIVTAMTYLLYCLVVLAAHCYFDESLKDQLMLHCDVALGSSATAVAVISHHIP